MINELLLIASVIICFGFVLLFFRLFGLNGLYGWTIFATIAANIEVLILVDAFGMEQTLGNVMFASTFLVTDIISENYGKKHATRAVILGIVTSLAFIAVSQLWLLFKASPNDFAMEHIQAIFSNTPRLMFASLFAYAVCQVFDVWAYHKWWNFTKIKFKDEKKFLWLRNNGSTLVSQLINTLIFTFIAFIGLHDAPTLLSIVLSSYVVFIFTSLLDTPVVYLARLLKPHVKDEINEE